MWPVCVVATLALLATLVDCGHHASIKSMYGQLVTSSTLKWRHMSATRGGIMPSDAVQSGTGNPSKVICRAEHHGSLLVGQTTQLDGQCAVAFINRIYKKKRFEILININRAARLEWKPYSKFKGAPEGAVAGVDESSAGSASGDRDVFIGRHLSSDTGRYRPGTVEVPRRLSLSSFGSMLVYDETADTVLEYSTGDVLVEVEPVRYELEIHDTPEGDHPDAARQLMKSRRKLTRHDATLAKSSLFRFDEGRDAEARLQKVLSYKLKTSQYYGQVAGMIRALPTSIRLSNGETQSVLWGLPNSSEQEETMMVGHVLQHHSAVDVSVVGVRITEEIPYKATLTAVFPDGTRRQRNNVEGVLQKKYLNNIRPEYSRVYQIKDSIVIDAGSSSSSEQSTKAATSPSKAATTTRKSSYSYNMEEEDGNGVVKKRDSHQMLSDQSNNVKKKNEESSDKSKSSLMKDKQQLLISSDSSSASSSRQMAASSSALFAAVLLMLQFFIH